MVRGVVLRKKGGVVGCGPNRVCLEMQGKENGVPKVSERRFKVRKLI